MSALVPLGRLRNHALDPWLNRELRFLMEGRNWTGWTFRQPLLPVVGAEIAEVIVPKIAALLAHSLTIGRLLTEGELAAASRDNPVNYRSVNLTCVTCKEMERVIAARLKNHLPRKWLLYSEQHGFRPQRSCITDLFPAYECCQD